MTFLGWVAHRELVSSLILKCPGALELVALPQEKRVFNQAPIRWREKFIIHAFIFSHSIFFPMKAFKSSTYSHDKF